MKIGLLLVFSLFLSNPASAMITSVYSPYGGGGGSNSSMGASTGAGPGSMGGTSIYSTQKKPCPQPSAVTAASPPIFDREASWQRVDAQLKEQTRWMMNLSKEDQITLGECFLPFFRGMMGQEEVAFHSSVHAITTQLEAVNPTTPTQELSKELGLLAVDQSSWVYTYQRNIEDAQFYKQLGQEFLDIAVGLDPVTGLGRSAYELITGENLITGMRLTQVERTFAVFGVITVGNGRWISNGIKALTRFVTGSQHLIKDIQPVQKAIARVEKILENPKWIKTETGEIQVFHRRQSDSHTLEHSVKMVESNELHGMAPRNIYTSHQRASKAYVGFLPEGVKGTEFITTVQPTHMGNGRNRALVSWPEGTRGVTEVIDNIDYVKIPIKVIKNNM